MTKLGTPSPFIYEQFLLKLSSLQSLSLLNYMNIGPCCFGSIVVLNHNMQWQPKGRKMTLIHTLKFGCCVGLDLANCTSPLALML
jgi:hypothetical protein